MADIPLKDFSKVLNDKLKDIEKQTGSPTTMKELAEMMKQDIIKRTKLGYGVNNPGDSQSKLKPLAESTKKSRKYKKLDGTTSPAKSNLTESGAMLNDLTTTVEQDGFSIGVTSQESKDKVKWNADMGRSFLNLSKSQIMAITAFLKKKIVEQLK